MNNKITLSTVLLICLNVANAVVPASVDRTEIEFGQSLTLTIKLNDSNQTPDLSALQQNFDIVNTGTSSQTSIINGSTSSQVEFNAQLIPKTEGKLVIPALKVANDVTAPIQIQVNKPSATQEGLADSKVTVEANIADSNPYQNTPTVLSVKILYSVPINNVNMAPINLPNSHIEPIDKSLQYQVTNHGKVYQVIEQKFLLTANQPGKLVIPPVRISGSMADEQSNDIFGLAMSKPFMALSKPLTVNIKAIPAGVDPKSWLPARNVELTDTWSTNTTNFKVGEAVTRTINVTAVGISGELIPEINILNPNTVNAYPDKATASTNTKGSQLIGSKSFKIAYIPTSSGEIELPQVSVSWWDTSANKLKTALIPAKKFMVKGSIAPISSQTVTPATPPRQTAVSTSTPQKSNTYSGFNRIWQYLTFVFALLWIITLSFTFRLYKHKPKTKSKLHNEINDSGQDRETLPADKLSAIKTACQERSIQGLNQALINWAEGRWQTRIYTISDIKKHANNPYLSELIDKMNLSLYKNQEFDKFAEIWTLIDELSVTREQKSKHYLQDFYPN